MLEPSLALLGRMAHAARSLHLGIALRGARDLADFCLAALRHPPLTAAHEGRILHGFLRHRGILHRVAAEAYEPFTFELVRRRLRPSSVVIDGGAHIGIFSLLTAPCVGAEGRILAFEPDPFNYLCLRRNLQANRCTPVIPIRKALADSVRRMTFYQSSSTVSSSLGLRGNLGSAWEGLTLRRVPVQAATLDAELAARNIHRVDLIKLDVEGAETMALRGMTETFRRNPHVALLAEINPSALAACGSSPDELLTLLWDLDFHVDFVQEDVRTLLPLRELGFSRKGMIYARRDC